MDDKYKKGQPTSTGTSTPGSSGPTSVELMMQKLRNEVHMISTNLTQVKDRSFRKSVSIMENHLVKNNEAFESHLKDVNEKHKNYVENKSKDYEDTISNLKRQLQERDHIVDKLKGRLDECRTARMEALEDLAKAQKHYGNRITELESCIAEGRENLILLQNERDRQRSEGYKVRDLEAELELAHSELQKMEDKLVKLENEVKEKQVLINSLQASKDRLDNCIETLDRENRGLRENLEKYMEMCKTKDESDDNLRKMMEKQLAKMQADWDDTKRQLALEQKRSENTDEELTELRKEAGLLRVDFRIESRHKKELETKLDMKERQVEDQIKKLADYERANDSLSTKIASYQDEVNSLNSQMKAKQEEHASLLAVQEELNEQKSLLEQDIHALRNELEVLKVKAKEVESMEKMISQKNEMIDEKMELIEQKNRRIIALQNNVDVLKEASVLLDSQLREFENALDKKLEALQDAEKFKELLENENKELREQLKNCKIDLNEAKSLKAFTEKRLELTESSLKSQSETQESEVQTMMEKLSMATARNEELSDEVNILMTQNSELEADKFELRKELETIKSEKERMNKEIFTLVNTVVNMKDEIMSLQGGVKEAISKAEKYKAMFESLSEKHNVLQVSQKTHELMYSTRIEQQAKLIDYLQEQLNASQDKKKKKGLMFTPRRVEKEAFTPAKILTPTPRSGFRPTCVPATPLCLQREKLAVQELEEQRETLISRLENLQKTTTPVTKKTPTLPQPRKEECILLKERSNTIAGGSGKPHRFLETRCESTQKCMACRDPVYKGRPISRCELCKSSFHLACATTASKSCGMPEKSAYELEKTVSSRRAEPITDEVDEESFKGWVKIRTEKMRSAEKLYLKIEGGYLNIYGSEKSGGKPRESLSLNEFTSVYFRIEKNAEEESSAHSDIAFAMKVNFDADEEQSAYMYMFHCNKKQKRYWIRGIQKYSKMHLVSSADNTFASDLSFCSTDENKENNVAIKVNENLVLEDKRSQKIYVNCVYLLPNTKVYLLGCDDGLYSMKSNEDTPVKIEGPQAIYQIDILAAAKTAVFIEGPKQVLSTVYQGLLRTCAEAAEFSNPKFTTQVVPQTKDCYMFASRGNSLRDTIVAAAGTNVLLLSAWTDDGLRLVKQIKMKDSITTMLMTPQTVLYGNHSVFEVDTKTFEQEPFLDSTDDAVYYVQLLNESHGSYPVAILDVTESRGSAAKEPEYLVCFQDIGIFVDSFGNRSRHGDVLWSNVPISFEYRHPFLYIFHFTTVEVQKLDEKSYTRVSTLNRAKLKSGEVTDTVSSKMISPPTRFITMSPKTTPNYVGKSKAGVVIALSDTRVTKVTEFTAIP